MSTHPERSAKSDRLDRIRAIIELIGVATLTLTHLVSAATALTTATRRRTRCR